MEKGNQNHNKFINETIFCYIISCFNGSILNLNWSDWQWYSFTKNDWLFCISIYNLSKIFIYGSWQHGKSVHDSMITFFLSIFFRGTYLKWWVSSNLFSSSCSFFFFHLYIISGCCPFWRVPILAHHLVKQLTHVGAWKLNPIGSPCIRLGLYVACHVVLDSLKFIQ